jgi:hypothetical protein
MEEARHWPCGASRGFFLPETLSWEREGADSLLACPLAGPRATNYRLLYVDGRNRARPVPKEQAPRQTLRQKDRRRTNTLERSLVGGAEGITISGDRTEGASEARHKAVMRDARRVPPAGETA